MVSAVEFQAAILSLMKLSSQVTNMIGEEVRERNWMGRDFIYPAVRVQILRMTPPPGENGECRPLMSDVLFTVLCYADGDSSMPCLQLMDAVQQSLKGKRLHTTAYIIPRNRIDILDFVWPVAEGDRVWRGEVQSRTQVKEPGWQA